MHLKLIFVALDNIALSTIRLRVVISISTFDCNPSSQ